MHNSLDKDAGKNSPFINSLKTETKAAFEHNGVKQYMVADYMGVANSTISKWLSENDTDWPTWDKWQDMMSYVQKIWGTVDHIRPVAHWFNQDLVGSYSDPRFALDRKSIGRLAGVIASKSGKVMCYLVQILEDGRIDPEEEEGLIELAPEINALLMAVQDLSDRCKAQREKRRLA